MSLKGTTFTYKSDTEIYEVLVVQHDRKIGLTVVSIDDQKLKLICLNRLDQLKRELPKQFYREFDKITNLIKSKDIISDIDVGNCIENEGFRDSSNVGITCAFE